MAIEFTTHFEVDRNKCIGCGQCVNVCTGMVLKMQNGLPVMQSFERYGWRGCWRCEHCLAVCPEGAISIFGKKPENSTPKPDKNMGEQMERLVKYRRSCRRFLDDNVDSAILDHILSAMENAPTGGNSCNVEYTVIDDKKRVDEIWQVAYDKMESLAKRGIYTHSFSPFFYGKMKESEETVREGDMLFCGAPHLFIAHEKCSGKWAEDAKANCIIATAYFELLANAFGLGTAIMSYPSEVLNELVPEARKMLNIPTDHYTGLIVGFGYPDIVYARGTQKDRSNKIHRYSKDNNKSNG